MDVIKIEFWDGSKYLCKPGDDSAQLIDNLRAKKRRKFLTTLSTKKQQEVIKKSNKRLGGLVRVRNIQMSGEDYNKVQLTGDFEREKDG